MRPIDSPVRPSVSWERKLTRCLMLASVLLCVLALMSGCATTQPAFRIQRVVVACPDNLVYLVPHLPDSRPPLASNADQEEFGHWLMDHLEVMQKESRTIAAECREWLKRQAK